MKEQLVLFDLPINPDVEKLLQNFQLLLESKHKADWLVAKNLIISNHYCRNYMQKKYTWFTYLLKQNEEKHLEGDSDFTINTTIYYFEIEKSKIPAGFFEGIEEKGLEVHQEEFYDYISVSFETSDKIYELIWEGDFQF